RLDYLPTDHAPYRITAYFRSEPGLQPMVDQFLEFFFECYLARRRFRRPRLMTDEDSAPIPDSLAPYRFEHYLSCHPGQVHGARWYCDQIHFESCQRSDGVGVVKGTITSGQVGCYQSYRFTGQVSRSFLSYTAQDCRSLQEYSASLECFKVDGEE